MGRSERTLWPWAVVAIAAVGFMCLFSAFWALMACSDDSGSPDRSYLDRCRAYDHFGDGWVDGAAYFFFAPLGVVLIGSVLAVSAKRQVLLVATATLAVALAVTGFLTGPLLFD